MLTAHKISSQLPLELGIAVGEGQALPEGASFADIFSTIELQTAFESRAVDKQTGAENLNSSDTNGILASLFELGKTIQAGDIKPAELRQLLPAEFTQLSDVEIDKFKQAFLKQVEAFGVPGSVQENQNNLSSQKILGSDALKLRDILDSIKQDPQFAASKEYDGVVKSIDQFLVRNDLSDISSDRLETLSLHLNIEPNQPESEFELVSTQAKSAIDDFDEIQNNNLEFINHNVGSLVTTNDRVIAKTENSISRNEESAGLDVTKGIVETYDGISTELEAINPVEIKTTELADDLKTTIKDVAAVNDDAEEYISTVLQRDFINQEQLQRQNTAGNDVVTATMQSHAPAVAASIAQANSQSSPASQNAVQTVWSSANSDGPEGMTQSGQFSQSFSQNSNSSSLPNMQAQAAVLQEQRKLSIDQQASLKEAEMQILKADKKDAALSAEFSSSERRALLPLGLQTIQIPVKSPQWGQALGQRVVYMANNRMQQAQITLNPEKLGPIQIKLQIDRDQQVHVSMTAHNGATREAMELALPRLKEMLEQSGMNLSSVDVNDQTQYSQQQDSQQDENTTANSQSGGVVESSEEQTSASIVSATDNIIDYYA